MPLKTAMPLGCRTRQSGSSPMIQCGLSSAKHAAGGVMFMLLTIYAIRASSQAAHYAMREVMQGGQVTSGELAVAEAQADPRVIAQANYARWQPAQASHGCAAPHRVSHRSLPQG